VLRLCARGGVVSPAVWSERIAALQQATNELQAELMALDEPTQAQAVCAGWVGAIATLVDSLAACGYPADVTEFRSPPDGPVACGVIHHGTPCLFVRDHSGPHMWDEKRGDHASKKESDR
jgi:hypothetical protein